MCATTIMCTEDLLFKTIFFFWWVSWNYLYIDSSQKSFALGVEDFLSFVLSFFVLLSLSCVFLQHWNLSHLSSEKEESAVSTKLRDYDPVFCFNPHSVADAGREGWMSLFLPGVRVRITCLLSESRAEPRAALFLFSQRLLGKDYMFILWNLLF